MERIENLLKHDLGANFDTRKTLNRSEARVPNEILEQIESGSFTCEMLDELASRFPVFRYQTQITIHGEFDVARTNIGNYKNIFQNGNLSLGVKYSAIDTDKIKLMRDMLDKVQIRGVGKDDVYFYFLQNSQTRVFRRSQSINKENALELTKIYRELAAKISQVKIYGYVDVYVANVYGWHKIIIDVHPLAIPLNKVNELVYAMLDTDAEGYEMGVKEVADVLRERKELSEQQDLIRRQKLNAFIERRTAFLAPYKAAGNLGEPTKLNDKNIVVKIDYESHEDEDPEFVFKGYTFYKVAGKGSFGKVKVVKAYSTEFRMDNLNWEDHKQVKLSDIITKGYLVTSIPVGAPAVSQISRDTFTMAVKGAVVGAESTGVQIVEYSDKAWAVIGDTKPIKEKLKDLGGRFNFNLTINDKKVIGWIFAKSSNPLEKLQKELGIN